MSGERGNTSHSFLSVNQYKTLNVWRPRRQGRGENGFWGGNSSSKEKDEDEDGNEGYEVKEHNEKVLRDFQLVPV